LCGTVYKQGNLIFTPDGNSVLSPVGNRLTVFDLVKYVLDQTESLIAAENGHASYSALFNLDSNKSVTFPYENRKNIDRIALSPNSTLLISVDEGEDNAHAYPHGNNGPTGS